MKIAVVGGGNGAFAVSSDFALQGHDVALFELPEFEKNIDAIRRAGGIHLTSIPSSGRGSGFARLRAGVDPEEVLRGAEVVFVVVPAYAQKRMGEVCAPYFKKEQTLCLMPGNLYGSIEFLRTLRRCGNKEVEAIAEMECLIYTATRSETGVEIRGFKRGLGLSVFPSRRMEAAAKVRALYPESVLRENVLATGASNPNVLLHVPLVLLNFANVERGLDVLSFHAAFTPGVARWVESMDAERMRLAEKGLSMVTTEEMVRNWYSSQGAGGKTIHEVMTTNPLYAASKLPKTITHRYFTEDVPYGVCSISELLRICGLPCRSFEAAAALASVACGENFSAKARTLASIGLQLDERDLFAYVANGE
ncbi:MAG: NAD/NADP octopine/nopaline dehydrogenase family protein [Synergistaceae bacterium]|jgi:opine dehydrogenase|nr:NAD/NADP octopine/nopaline dehydrogenase family protein [Synergistaceae bacterium]